MESRSELTFIKQTNAFEFEFILLNNNFFV